ncbi:MAG TPA: hypothetical protein VE572_05105, partial [Nitrososphaeraceae archaeon]|nr:hypothetical protein [Nitrososphaeraceae archaeon]
MNPNTSRNASQYWFNTSIVKRTDYLSFIDENVSNVFLIMISLPFNTSLVSEGRGKAGSLSKLCSYIIKIIKTHLDA